MATAPTAANCSGQEKDAGVGEAVSDGVTDDVSELVAEMLMEKEIEGDIDGVEVNVAVSVPVFDCVIASVQDSTVNNIRERRDGLKRPFAFCIVKPWPLR
jgi:hypothetical protein